MSNPEKQTTEDGPAETLRSSDWSTDGVAMNAEGQLVIREGSGSSPLCRAAKPAQWCEIMARQYETERELSEAERAINARHPDRFLPDAIAELEKRAAEAGALRGDGIAGKVMWGQAQAYRDAIALLKTFFH